MKFFPFFTDICWLETLWNDIIYLIKREQYNILQCQNFLIIMAKLYSFLSTNYIFLWLFCGMYTLNFNEPNFACVDYI